MIVAIIVSCGTRVPRILLFFFNINFLFQMLINLEGQILILDEGHNMEDACRSATSLDVTNLQLDSVKEELLGLLKSPGMVLWTN